jgi:hypothetical protein
MKTAISFDTSNYPKNMAGAGQLPLVISPTIANVRLYHVLVDGGATLNLIILAAFQKLQIPMSKLIPSCPFLGVGSGFIIPCSSISIAMTFSMPENYRMESVIFDSQRLTSPSTPSSIDWPCTSSWSWPTMGT